MTCCRLEPQRLRDLAWQQRQRPTALLPCSPSPPPAPSPRALAVAPAVLAIEALYYGKRASPRVTASVALVCLGVGLATITDPQISSNLFGLAVGFGSVGATALYQIWAGSKQKELGLGSMQLMHQFIPLAAVLLAILVPICEPMGWTNPTPDTILGYHFTPKSVVAIAISSVLGLLVSLSTFLVSGGGRREEGGAGGGSGWEAVGRRQKQQGGSSSGSAAGRMVQGPAAASASLGLAALLPTNLPPLQPAPRLLPLSPSLPTPHPHPRTGDWRHELSDVQRGGPHQNGAHPLWRRRLLRGRDACQKGRRHWRRDVRHRVVHADQDERGARRGAGQAAAPRRPRRQRCVPGGSGGPGEGA